MALEHYKTQVLLLHSQQSTLDALSTGFSDRYSVHCATTGSEALSTLGVTPIHVIVSAQDLPGMSGLEALREARKRSPDTIGILLAGRDQSDGLEALVGDKEVFQIVRGEITPEALRNLIDTATKRARLIALSESANDTAANVDEPMGEHIVMETSENGATIISDGSGTMPALKPQKIQLGVDLGSRGIDILVLTKDEEFLSTVKDSARGLHKVLHAATPAQAESFFKDNKIGVLVTDAAMVGSNIEVLTQRLRAFVPRLVAIVAGRRDDGELLMDLINRGHVYRFLLKPVSPGRARLAIEASVKHHLDASDTAFKPVAGRPPAAPVVKPAPEIKPQAKAAPEPKPRPNPESKPRPEPRPEQKVPAAKPAVKPPAKPAKAAAVTTPQRKTPTISGSPINDGLDDAFGNESSFTETMTGIVATIGKSLAGGIKKAQDEVTQVASVVPKRVSPGLVSLLRTPKFLAAGAGALLLLIASIWMFSGSESDNIAVTSAGTETPAQVSDPALRNVESAVPRQPAAQPRATTGSSYADLLDEARIARDGGEIIHPRGSSAIELYVAARDAAPGDVVLANELTDLVNIVLGMAESALLAGDAAEADAAISMVRLATPENPRLLFLGAQLSQLQYRSALDNARAAIREKRFEDAEMQLANARSIAVPDLSDVNLLTEELGRARSEQKIDEVLALAAKRLEEGKFTSPTNNNARYFYELALSSNPANTVAQQGLIFVASQLVLKARAAIDNGQLDQAAELIDDASELDPNNSELAASTAALQSARQTQADAARRAERERQAELDRQAEAAKQAELERQASAKRAAEAERIAEEERQAESRGLAAGAAAVAAAATEQPELSAGSDSTSNAMQASARANDALPQPMGSGSESRASVSEPEPGSASTAEQTLAAAASEVVSPGTANTSGVAQEPALVSVSTLTRVQYVSPRYPRGAMRRGVTGFVDLTLTIARDGSVYNVVVQSAEPETTFNEAAIEAVSQWQFEPVIESGVAVEKRTAVRMAFALEE